MRFLLLLFIYMHLVQTQENKSVLSYITDFIQSRLLARFKNEPERSKMDFMLFTREIPSSGIELENDFTAVNSTRPIKFLIHGHLENLSARWYKRLSKGLLKKGDYSIVQVDWSYLAGRIYPIAVHNTKMIGNCLGEFIVQLNQETKIPFSKFHLIGHSLGGHVAGFAGKKVIEMTGKKIRQITALDAAGPLFELPEKPKNERLSDEDAEIVETIHTDGGVFGYKAPFGTIDIFPDGGTRIQPGCGFDGFFRLPFNISSLHPVCSHRRSREYYIEAILKGGIPAIKCDSYQNFKKGKCQENNVILLGNDYVDSKIRGTFYF